jgi:Fis family transcriptional regulator
VASGSRSFFFTRHFVFPAEVSVKSQLESLVQQMQDGGILYSEAVDEFRRVFIFAMLERHKGNQCRAARALGMHRNTLSRNFAALKILAKSQRRPPVQIAQAKRRTA